MLRQVASTAENLAQLHQVSGGGSYARIQRQTVALYAFQLKTHPMVLRASLGTQNHRLAHQVFNHRLHLAVVEKIAHCEAAAHLRDLKRVSSQLADIPEGSVPLVDEQEFRLHVFGGSVRAVHLGIHVPVDQEEILPAVVVEVDKSVSPPHIALRASGNTGSNRRVGEVYRSIIAINGGVLNIKM